MKKSSNKKYTKPDDYMQMGPLEIARFGKVVTMKNNMTKEEHTEFIGKLALRYDDVVKQINETIMEIRELISHCNPLKLLQYGYGNFIMSLMGITSEVQMSAEDVFSGRELEYMQSIIVATPIDNISDSNEEDPSKTFLIISEKIHNLYRMVQEFYIFYTAKERVDNPDVSPELEQFIIESQMAMFNRGERYPIYEIEHLEELLEIHSEVFPRIFNITVGDFIVGLKNIQRSLSTGMASAMNDLEEMMTAYETFILAKENSLETMEATNEAFRDLLNNDSELKRKQNGFVGKFTGYDLFDLSLLTNWPEEFQKKLAWGVNENKLFFNTERYAGWPLIELPVFQRPFIFVDNKGYCFDYYNLFDNIYRVIQKLITKEEPSYQPIWSEKQKVSTETIVGKLFSKLLPGCTILQSNYYPIAKSLKQCAENDILIIYDGNLFIVEVKAGSYTYTAPIRDIISHIESLKTLVGKADSQAARTFQYLQSDKSVKLYDEDREEKYQISLSDFKEITTFCVTLDNFNEFAAKAEKISFISLKNNTVVLSIDDLRVYAGYFESPCTFLHFLKQRKLSANIDKLALNDELDHLGMYISHNMYSITAAQMDNGNISWLGYREKLDQYFSSLFHEGMLVEKPMQKVPRRLLEIINSLDNSSIPGRVSLACYLLDLSSETRESFCNFIEDCLVKQKQSNRMLIVSTFGDVRYSVFCHQTEVDELTDEYMRDYVLATLNKFNEESRLELHLYYNKNLLLEDIKYTFIKRSDIPVERLDELSVLGDKYAESRITSYKSQNNNNKIGRNEKCPCGSGLKYKNCHGK